MQKREKEESESKVGHAANARRPRAYPRVYQKKKKESTLFWLELLPRYLPTYLRVHRRVFDPVP